MSFESILLSYVQTTILDMRTESKKQKQNLIFLETKDDTER